VSGTAATFPKLRRIQDMYWFWCLHERRKRQDVEGVEGIDMKQCRYNVNVICRDSNMVKQIQAVNLKFTTQTISTIFNYCIEGVAVASRCHRTHGLRMTYSRLNGRTAPVIVKLNLWEPGTVLAEAHDMYDMRQMCQTWCRCTELHRTTSNYHSFCSIWFFFMICSEVSYLLDVKW